MTKKDYIAVAIAEIIQKQEYNTSNTARGYVVLRSVANDLADWFKRDNPRFDCERFLAACQLDYEPLDFHKGGNDDDA